MKADCAKGFTLIEILVALAVFAILATLTSSAMYNAFNNRARVNIQANQLSQLQLTFVLLSRDILQAQNREVKGNNMRVFPGFVGQPNYIEFTRIGLINPNATDKKSTLERIAYLCKNDKLIRRHWLVVDTLNRQQFKDMILLDNLEQCQFSYLDYSLQVLNTWEALNVSELDIKEELPKAIQVNFTLKHWGQYSGLFPIPKAVYIYEADQV